MKQVNHRISRLADEVSLCVYLWGPSDDKRTSFYHLYDILTCGNMLSCGNYIFLTFFFPAITLTLQDRTYSDFIANQRRCGRSGSKISTIKISRSSLAKNPVKMFVKSTYLSFRSTKKCNLWKL